MDLQLNGAKVLVIAASQGLGAATALAFSREGATVAINSRNPESLTQTANKIHADTGNTVYPFAADVTDNSATQQLVEQVAGKLGGIDILVTNAGGPPAGTFDDFEQSHWESAVQLNLLSTVNIIRAALPYLRQSNRAAILTITSITAKQPVHNLTLSNAIRPAVIGLTKTLSLELGTEGIRVNSILPGMTDTERVTSLMTTRAKKNSSTIEDEYQKAATETAIGRIGKPEEFANAAVFLCSPAAAFITGVSLAVDGGATRGIL